VLKECHDQARPGILVGATGSGKSTTLAAMVDYRNEKPATSSPSKTRSNSCTRTRTASSPSAKWAGYRQLGSALKNTLRQAPDVILIGEIRDRETMEHAIAFAETGHLCLATLHANSANQALDRIINFFPEERRRSC
jgi:twitching motility protein PilU